MHIAYSDIDGSKEPSQIQKDMFKWLAPFMLLGGIQELRTSRYEVGAASETIVTASFFKDVPREVVKRGAVLKNHIMAIAAVAGITGIALRLSEKEMADNMSLWGGGNGSLGPELVGHDDEESKDPQKDA